MNVEKRQSYDKNLEKEDLCPEHGSQWLVQRYVYLKSALCAYDRSRAMAIAAICVHFVPFSNQRARCGSLFLNEHVFLLLLRRPESAVFAGVRIASPWAVWYCHTTIWCPHIDRLGVLLGLRVDSDIDRCVKTVLDRFANKGNLQNWIIATLLTHVKERVRSVGGDGLFVDVVRSCLFNLAEKALLNVELANVRDCATLDGVIGQ